MEDLLLEFNETVNFSMIKGDAVVIIDVLESRRGVKKANVVGQHDPWHASALGKCLRASMSDAEWRNIVGTSTLPAFTAQTITPVDELSEEIARTRDRGYAIDNEEADEELCCVAAAVPGRPGQTPEYALNVSFVTHRLAPDSVAQAGQQVQMAADKLVPNSGNSKASRCLGSPRRVGCRSAVRRHGVRRTSGPRVRILDGVMKAKNSSSRSEPTRVALMTAALQVITETGVKSVTHRKVCAAANLSLGTVNYHYSDLNELLLDAFSWHVDEVSAKYEDSFPIAHDDEGLADAVLQLVAALSEDTKSAILMWELYAEAGRDKIYRRLVRKWSRRAKSGVEQFCAPPTATALEALWDGTVMQRILGEAHLSDADLRDVILAIIRLDTGRSYPAAVTTPSRRTAVASTKRPRRGGKTATASR